MPRNPQKPLELGNAQVIVVYGLNASGKSGYIRAFKHASGQRNPGPLHQDVFSPQKFEQSCRFKCEIDGAAKELQWSQSKGPLAELRGLQVYDTNCGSIYINAENEAAYEPFELTLLTHLTEACSRVSAALDLEILGKPSRKPTMPPGLLTTQSAIWYGKLSRLTTPPEIAQRCHWAEELEGDLLNLNQRLVEANPSGKAKDIRKLKDKLMGLHRGLAEWGGKLSDDGCASFLEVVHDSRAKRQAADDAAKVVFATAPLDGVGSETWKLLWQQARAYSEKYAYKDSPFPNTDADALCVLCQQPLDSTARKRLVSFESFVMGGLESQAQAAINNVEELYKNFGGVPTEDATNLLMDSLGLKAEAEREAIVSYRRSLEARLAALVTVDEASQLPPTPDEGKTEFLKDRAAHLEEQATALDQDALGQNRPSMENKRDELVARRWLWQQQASIQQEIDRLKLVHRLQEAKHLTSTQQLSTKKSSLAEKLITGAFVGRFQSELEGLGAGRIKVSLMKTRAERGRVFHEIRLLHTTKAVQASEVLSEGEFRIVSLAAFLADVEGRGDTCPFIFDDPISSLDHIFEEATARRLVVLSKTRQVIVFTHRLSLLDYIEGASEKSGIGSPTVISLRREHWGLGEPGEPSMNEMKPEGALDQLVKRLAEAQKTLEQIGQSKYEEQAKGICGDLRVLLERIIEKILLSGVVRRYSREVQTKGKIQALAKITPTDCSFFDQLMTKYSIYEHSQPEEAPVHLPQPTEISADLKSIREWIVEFKRRP